MNILTKSLIVFLIFAYYPGYSQATNGNDVVVEVSKDKVMVNNKSYFLHKVKKGENLFRISKAYNVTQKDIIIANPEAISGNIKEGQVLKIPGETSARSVSQIESDNFIYHIAEDKQTVYYITQKYKISQEELLKYNPELQYSQLQAGQVVKIPKTPNAPVGTDKFKPFERYDEYKVGRSETMYSIAKEHNITVNDLIAANPILNKEDLKKGQVIQIPVRSENEIVAIPVVNKTDTPKIAATTKIDTSIPCNSHRFDGTIQVAILLPISMEGYDANQLMDSTTSANDGERAKLESSDAFVTTLNLMEFYQGALLAIDSLKSEGISVKVHTYDTGRDNQKLSGILGKQELTKMDLIIGPLTYNAESIEKTAQFALKNQIKMVSPVSPNIKSVLANPYFFQVNANETYNIDAIMKYIGNTYEKRNIILVNSGRGTDKDTFTLFKNKLTALYPNQFKVFNYGGDPKKISIEFSKDKDNIVIIPSEHEATVSSLLNVFSKHSQSLSIKVIGMPIWAIFKGLNQDLLYSFEYQYATSFYVDLTAPITKSFMNKYKLYYKSLPIYHTKDNSPQFVQKDGYNMAFLGYDEVFYFLSSISQMGKNFENCIGQRKIDLLHTNIIYEKSNPLGGYVNKGVNILKYTKDYKIVKAN